MNFSLLPTMRADAWFNVSEWEQTPAGFRPWRVTPHLVATARNEHFTNRVSAPAGVRAEVLTDAKKLEIALTPLMAGDETPLVVDVVFNGDLIKRAHLTQHATSTPITQLSFDLPARVGRLEVWLPHASGVVLNQIELTGATVCRSVDPRPRWVTYGSSITHCIEADGPSQTWPALVGRALDLELYGLGLAAQCHLDYAIEEQIAQLAPRYISMCLGINIYGRGSFDERSLPGALYGFIDRVRRQNPQASIAVISPITSPPAEDTENHVGLPLSRIRDIVREVSTEFARSGIDYIHGPDILGPKDASAQLREDELHPHSDGYAFMAQRLTPALRDVFNLQPPSTKVE